MKYNILNGDIESQLLSIDFHKILYKFRDDSKIARRLMKLNRLGYKEKSTRHVHLEKNHSITFLPKGKKTELNEEYSTGETWTSKNRQSAKYGKVLKKLLSEHSPDLKIKEVDVEKLVNLIKAELSEGDFSEVQGDDIAKWYHHRTYTSKESASLGNSCMRTMGPEVFKIYSINPDVAKMIILVKDEKLVGRAILWKVEDEKEFKWMDRVYGSDSIIEAFKLYAQQKGYFYKRKQTYNQSLGWIHPKTKETFNKSLRIYLKTEFDHYPYFDTFYYLNTDKGFIHNDETEWNAQDELRDTNGGTMNSNMQEDFLGGGMVDEDDAFYIDGQGWTHRDNCIEDDETGGYILEEESRRFTNRNGHERHTHDENDDLIEIDDVWYLNHETFECAYLGERVSESERTPMTVLGKTICDIYEEEYYEQQGYIRTKEGEWEPKTETK
tara:strand:- start:3453 stop:4769 length:1317 start_codon:yes stop_codon:yes gene_type:complete